MIEAIALLSDIEIAKACSASILFMLPQKNRLDATIRHDVTRFVHHVMRYLTEPKMVAIYTTALLARLLKKSKIRHFDSNYIYQFILVAFIIASAALEDITYLHADWAKVAYNTYDIFSIVNWENQVLNLLGFDILLTKKQFASAWESISHLYVTACDSRYIESNDVWAQIAAQVCARC